MVCPQTKPSSVPFLKDLMSTSKYIFLGLTETWLTDSHKNAELEIDKTTQFSESEKRQLRKKLKYGLERVEVLQSMSAMIYHLSLNPFLHSQMELMKL